MWFRYNTANKHLVLKILLGGSVELEVNRPRKRVIIPPGQGYSAWYNCFHNTGVTTVSFRPLHSLHWVLNVKKYQIRVQLVEWCLCIEGNAFPIPLSYGKNFHSYKTAVSLLLYRSSDAAWDTSSDDGQKNNLSQGDYLHHKTVKTILQATVVPSAQPLVHQAVLGFRGGGREWPLAVLGFCLALLPGCPVVSVGCGPLLKRKCSQAGIDSSTATQYCVYNRKTTDTLMLIIQLIIQSGWIGELVLENKVSVILNWVCERLILYNGSSTNAQIVWAKGAKFVLFLDSQFYLLCWAFPVSQQHLNTNRLAYFLMYSELCCIISEQ